MCPNLATRCPPLPTECPVTMTVCPPFQTQCPAEFTICPVDATGTCVSNAFGRNFRYEGSIPNTARVVPSKAHRLAAGVGRVCPVGTERVPEISDSPATARAPGLIRSAEKPEPVAVRPEPLQKPVAADPAGKLPVAATQRGLPAYRPLG